MSLAQFSPSLFTLLLDDCLTNVIIIQHSIDTHCSFFEQLFHLIRGQLLSLACQYLPTMRCQNWLQSIRQASHLLYKKMRRRINIDIKNRFVSIVSKPITIIVVFVIIRDKLRLNFLGSMLPQYMALCVCLSNKSLQHF